MKDFKKQLAAIRPSLPKAKASETPNSDPSLTVLNEKKSGTKNDALLRKCLERLPFFGNINKLESPKYGFVNTNDGDLFFHVSGRLPPTDEVVDNLKNRIVVYTAGSSEIDGSEIAVQWALVDDIAWPKYQIPKSQSQLDDLRTDW